MRGLGASLTRAIVIAMSVYLIVIGATFNGIVFPEFKMLTLGALSLLGAAWLWSRWRGGWRWHRMALDGVMLLWALAFGLSLLANGEAWRRIVVGLWFVGMYIITWYALQDLLANGRLRRETLVDGLLVGGVMVMIFGFMQLQGGLARGELPRPVGPL
ncbi:MAG: hypothetical protein H7175_20815, partial [Burkholderiales bacterium]|nr:hypothetical protein [Anaerolineae bacterium]